MNLLKRLQELAGIKTTTEAVIPGSGKQDPNAFKDDDLETIKKKIAGAKTIDEIGKILAGKAEADKAKGKQ